jgi:16S rRNA (adenine1518-N6/adenine1519-N6)-dimethyltransferase
VTRAHKTGAPRARKRFGQHFLEAAWVDKVVRAVQPKPGETFLEIGPGRGALTMPLAAAAERVIAFEIDRDLAALVRRTAPATVTISEGDFLDATPASVTALTGVMRRDARLRAAGNLPYNVASPILFRLIDLYRGGVPLSDATVMLQREVADRLLASPGSKDYGVLTILVGRHADMTRLLNLPRGAFRPAPRVESTVVRLVFRPPAPAARDERVFEGLVKALFTRRRKTLLNALLAYEPAARGDRQALLERAGLSGDRRPETLDAASLVRLADAVAATP